MSNMINNEVRGNANLDLFKNAANNNVNNNKENDRILFSFKADGQSSKYGNKTAWWATKATKHASIEKFRQALVQEYGQKAVDRGTNLLDRLQDQHKSLRSADITNTIANVKTEFDKLADNKASADGFRNRYFHSTLLALKTGGREINKEMASINNKLTNTFTQFPQALQSQLADKALTKFNEFIAELSIKPSLLNDASLQDGEIASLIHNNLAKFDSIAKEVSNSFKLEQKNIALGALADIAKNNNIQISNETLGTVYYTLLARNSGKENSLEKTLLTLSQSSVENVFKSDKASLPIMQALSVIESQKSMINENAIDGIAKGTGTSSNDVKEKLNTTVLHVGLNIAIATMRDNLRSTDRAIPSMNDVKAMFDEKIGKFVNDKVELYKAVDNIKRSDKQALSDNAKAELRACVLEQAEIKNLKILNNCVNTMKDVNGEALMLSLLRGDVNEIGHAFLNLGKEINYYFAENVPLEDRKDVDANGVFAMQTVNNILLFDLADFKEEMQALGESKLLIADGFTALLNEVSEKVIDLSTEIAMAELRNDPSKAALISEELLNAPLISPEEYQKRQEALNLESSIIKTASTLLGHFDNAQG